MPHTEAELQAMTPQARYRSKNRSALNALTKAWHAQHRNDEAYKTANRQRVKKWREENPEKSRESIKRSRKKDAGRLANNACRVRNKRRRPELVVKARMRARVAEALKGHIPKANTTEALIGCTYAHLKEYIEGLFQPGMSWENRHLWHVDHIRPCVAFNLLDPNQQRCCFHYSNLQPLWAKDNLSKADKCL